MSSKRTVEVREENGDQFFSISQSVRDLKSPLFWRGCVMELLATATLVAFLFLSFVTLNSKAYPVSTTHIGLMMGFLVFILIEAYGPYSGAHMNTAVTLALLLAGKISPAKALVYIVVQLIGGVGGGYLAYTLSFAVGDPNRVINAFNPEPGLSPLKGMGVEAILTFNFIIIVLSTTDAKNRNPSIMAGLPIGFGIGCGIMAGGTHSGAAINPVVAMAASVVSKVFKNHWVYWAGPLGGSALAAGVYILITMIKAPRPAPPPSTELTYSVRRDDLLRIVDKLLQEQSEG